jgi:hypothetical protein
VDDKGEPIVWVAQSFTTMQTTAGKIVTEQSYIAAGEADTILAVWYQAPGTQLADAYGIDVEAELIREPYKAGTYFIRLGGDHYRCSPLGDTRLNPMAKQLADERQIENQAASIARLQKRVDEQDDQIVKLRAERNDLTDKYETALRRTKALEEQLADAIDAADPWMGPEQMAQLMPLFESWAYGESGGLLADWYVRAQDLFTKLLADPVIVKRLGLHHTEAFNAYHEAHNAVARFVLRGAGECKQLPSGDQIKLFVTAPKVEPVPERPVAVAPVVRSVPRVGVGVRRVVVRNGA